MRVKELRAANADHIREQKKQDYRKHRQKYLAAMREYDAKHADKKRAVAKQWAQEHPERVSERHQLYRQEHAEQIKATYREWYQENRGTALACAARRKARFRNAPGHFTAQDLKKQHEKQGGLCFYCGDALKGLGTIDHYVPLARGGTNYPDNIVLACWPCNNAKRARMPDDFLRVDNKFLAWGLGTASAVPDF